MITVPIDPIILTIGHFHLRWYSLIVMGVVALGVWLGVRSSNSAKSSCGVWPSSSHTVWHTRSNGVGGAAS
jgi:prolipoprotein diacylglyceryltransferase